MLFVNLKSIHFHPAIILRLGLLFGKPEGRIEVVLIENLEAFSYIQID